MSSSGPSSPTATTASHLQPSTAAVALTRLPSLSVVVPNYNHAKYLPQSLPAILSQTVQPMEVLVLDDASTDDSVEVIKGFARQNPLVRLIENEKNLGVMPNLNKGVDLARGDYVFIGSADDEVVPGLFEKSLRLLAQHPQAALSCTVCEWRYTDSGLRWLMATGMAEGPAYLPPEELVRLGRRGKLAISSSSVIFRREALRDVGKFMPQLRWHADWFACYISALRFGVCYVPESLSLVNILPKSFYTAGSQRPEHREVLRQIVTFLGSPAYQDVRPRVRDSGALSVFATPMLRVLLSRREFRSFINWPFLRWLVWRNAELTGKKVLPVWLARWLLNRFYGKAK